MDKSCKDCRKAGMCMDRSRMVTCTCFEEKEEVAPVQQKGECEYIVTEQNKRNADRG